MVQLLAQTGNSLDFTVYIQDLIQKAIGVDAIFALKLLLFWIFIIWFVFALWVALDAAARYKQWYVALGWFIFVLPFNVLGFIGYLFMRPPVTLDEKQWTRLESKYLMNELSSVNDCPTCGTLVPVAQNYCAVCGTQMNINCPQCDNLQSIYNAYCTSCGKQLAPEERRSVVKNLKEATKPEPRPKTENFMSKLQSAFSQTRSRMAATTGKEVDASKSEKKSDKKGSTQAEK